jgi:hypothetical protein
MAPFIARVYQEFFDEKIPQRFLSQLVERVDIAQQTGGREAKSVVSPCSQTAYRAPSQHGGLLSTTNS